MRVSVFQPALLIFGLMAFMAGQGVCKPVPDVQTTAAAFLKAYAAGDRATVMSMTDKDDLHVYGSDISEASTGVDAFGKMFDLDQKLWQGSASFGEMSDISTVKSGPLATLFFDDDFTVGGHTLKIRFATVWKLERGQWKLVQSSNVVPTTGQSAADILGLKP
jgi:hypothetical protein